MQVQKKMKKVKTRICFVPTFSQKELQQWAMSRTLYKCSVCAVQIIKGRIIYEVRVISQAAKIRRHSVERIPSPRLN